MLPQVHQLLLPAVLCDVIGQLRLPAVLCDVIHQLLLPAVLCDVTSVATEFMVSCRKSISCCCLQCCVASSVMYDVISCCCLQCCATSSEVHGEHVQ
jgi:hypothetical protein